jgi:hypothetical protein
VVHKLQFRLFVAFGLVILVTVAGVFFFVMRAARGEVR